MLRRTLAVAALALASACARAPHLPATLHLDPGEGTFSVRDLGVGGERVCSTECRQTYPAGTRLELELTWPRPDGTDRATTRLSVGADRAIRGEWNDRGGLRAVGAVILLVGLGGGGGIVGAGVGLSESGRREAGIAASVVSAFVGGFVVFIGVAVGVAGIVVGSVLLGLRDHAAIQIGPLRDAHVTLSPTDGGATLALGGRF